MRFQLRTLMILMTVCAVAFALIRANLFVISAALVIYGVASVAMAYLIACGISGINSFIGRLQGKR